MLSLVPSFSCPFYGQMLGRLRMQVESSNQIAMFL